MRINWLKSSGLFVWIHYIRFILNHSENTKDLPQAWFEKQSCLLKLKPKCLPLHLGQLSQNLWRDDCDLSADPSSQNSATGHLLKVTLQQHLSQSSAQLVWKWYFPESLANYWSAGSVVTAQNCTRRSSGGWQVPSSCIIQHRCYVQLHKMMSVSWLYIS